MLLFVEKLSSSQTLGVSCTQAAANCFAVRFR
jgi:hypothetical protein